ncbi:MAG: hypothetical protein KC933_26090 [Myxococcales bacterium]|nr:hypothetical protein [Myxococcales bacterium]MCB9647252.1 hypothetical protein [Deltaproteobacteria bacterium]
MSITYSLYLHSSRRPTEVLDQLSAGLGVHDGAVDALDLAVTAVTAPTDRFIREDFGVEPQIRVSMRLHKDRLDKAQDRVVDVLTVSLGQSADDLVLLREDESIAYRRSAGSSELGEGDPLWADPARRSKVDRAQRRRRITLG